MVMKGIDFSKVPCIYWSDRTKASYLQRRIIVYSIMYYKLNESCISDAKYEAIVKQFVELKLKMDPEEFKKTKYYYVMYDFDGSTGFDLYYRLNTYDRQYLVGIAKSVLKQWKKEN